jgi:hypothetical protein
MRLITQVTSFDTSSMLLKCFPVSGFFNFGNKSKSGGLSPPEVWKQIKVWWAQPTRLWLVLKIKETTPWETLQKHWGGVWWGDLSNQTHQQRRRPDRNTILAETLDRCDKSKLRLYWKPVNLFCKINLFLKKKTYRLQNFWNDPRNNKYLICYSICIRSSVNRKNRFFLVYTPSVHNN